MKADSRIKFLGGAPMSVARSDGVVPSVHPLRDDVVEMRRGKALGDDMAGKPHVPSLITSS